MLLPKDLATGQPIPGPTRPLDDLNPLATWTSLLATAKAAEEGDADLTAAFDQYPTIVRIFDQLRPSPSGRLDRVWGVTAFPTTRTVDKHIVSLRQKIEVDPAQPRWIHTVHGTGYRLELPPPQLTLGSL